ncbi:copper amine oxidase [Paenibacillus yanchengensis]|uniref:Copper amine oxidase n=1 Tax=Paenibacillus yanchengensis TaxID=2035833 RepID=A0ABW4YKP4_9BACL
MSMKKKVAVALLLLTVWGGSMAFANSTATKVQVWVNGSAVSESGMLLDQKSYLPLRELASSFKAILIWDENNKTAKLFAPNVHMFVYQGNKPFGEVVRSSQAQKFKVFSQIDNLKTDISSVKVSIADPKGKETMIQTQSVTSKSDNFWFVTEEIDYKFDTTGKYTIRFSMKLSANDDWTVVSEKMINAR